MSGTYYFHQNVDLFWMAVKHFGVKFEAIDKVDRRTRKVHLLDGTVLDMPEDWNVS